MTANPWIDQTDYTLTTPLDSALTEGVIDQLRRVMDPNGVVDAETRAAGTLRLAVSEADRGTSLDRCERAVAVLTNGAASRPVQVWSTPYESLGTLARHVPGLGYNVIACDDDATPYLDSHAVLDVLARTRNPERLPEALYHLMGTAWSECFETYGPRGPHAPGEPPLNAQHAITVTEALRHGWPVPEGDPVHLAFQYLDAYARYARAYEQWQDQACTTDPARLAPISDRCTLLREALHRHGCRLRDESVDSITVVLPIGAAFTVRH